MFCFQLKTALHPTCFNGQALSLLPFVKVGQWPELQKVNTQRRLSLRRHHNCLVLSQLLAVCSSELLIACLLSLWVCISLPREDTGPEKPCKGTVFHTAAASCCKEEPLHQADDIAWGDIALSQPSRLQVGKSSRERKCVPVPVALLPNYSCIHLHDRCHWGNPALLLLGLQRTGQQPRVNLLLEQGDLAGVC